MEAQLNVIDGRTGGGLGLSLLGLAGTASAVVAALLMWTLLTAPAQLVVGMASGPSALAGVLVRIVFDAVARVLSWF